MNFVFRVDSSIRIGTGHIMRCLTLAEALRRRGSQVRFICREHTGSPIAILRQRAMSVTLLPPPRIGDNDLSENYAAWLGASLAEDAEQTITALGGEQPDWLVVDHYGIDIEWEQSLRPHVHNVMVIDDLANRRHDCDVLLDQNYSLEGGRRYANLVPKTCTLLIGPRYALMHPEYAVYRKTQWLRDGQVDRVLVFFGGSDPQNLTGMALEALSQSDLSHLAVDVVVGANNIYKDSIARQATHRPLTRLHEPRPHLADLMAHANLAIGAGGATTWERMCLGLPTVVVTNAENQRPASEALAQAGLILYAGHFSEVDTEQLAQALRNLIENCESFVLQLVKSQLQVDGLGTMRLVEVLCPSACVDIVFRPASEEDTILYHAWANDPVPDNDVADPTAVSWRAQSAWLATKLRDENSRLFVYEVANLPIGQIRFEYDGDDVCIDNSLDPIVRGRGWDSQLIAMGVRLVRQAEPVRFTAEARERGGMPATFFLRLGCSDATNSGRDIGRGFSISVLSDRASWMNEHIPELLLFWITAGHRVLWVHDSSELHPGDFCFYLGCGQIVPDSIRSRYRNNLVVHESDLPKGKGWSPLTWQIIEGAKRVPVTLLEANAKVDSGVIYAQEWMEFKGDELIDELREAQVKATLKLCRHFVESYPQILSQAREQVGEGSFYPRRRSEDSEIDPTRTIAAQFSLFRVADNHRYPLFFYMHGQRYVLRIDNPHQASCKQDTQG